MTGQEKEIRILIDLINEGFNKRAWHGTNLRGSIKGLNPRQALWRPGQRRHNIWEVVIHCAYWKYAVRRRIVREKRGAFYRKGSNWFRVSHGEQEVRWKKDVAMLKFYHEQLLDVVNTLQPADLKKTPVGSSVDIAATLRGIACHDVYHAGQIQLLKRLKR